MNRYYSFDQFQFNALTGELIRDSNRDKADNQDTKQGSKQVVSEGCRLAPQPAKLLELLLVASPELLSRDQIRHEIWPDIQVDFDRNLHFCIRQIRSALGESASTPHIIETIPRRGYRIRSSVQIAHPSDQKNIAFENRSESDQHSRDQLAERFMNQEQVTVGHALSRRALPSWRNERFDFKRVAIGIFVLTAGLPLFTILSAGMAFTSSPEPPRVVRLGVMPLQFADASTPQLQENELAELFVARLTADPPFEIELIGPTTTEAFTTPEDGMQELIDSHRLDLIINGRKVGAGMDERMLVELIRAEDGVHVWVRYFNNTTDPSEIVEEAVAAIGSWQQESPR